MNCSSISEGQLDKQRPFLYVSKKLKKSKVEHFQLKKLNYFEKKKKTQQKDKTQVEMTEKIAAILEQNAVKTKEVIKLTKKINAAKLEQSELQTKINEMKSTREEFMALLEECTNLNLEIKEQKQLIEMIENEMQVILNEKEELETYSKYYQDLETKHNEILKGISILKSLPKDEELVNAEQKEQNANIQINKLTYNIESFVNKIENNIKETEELSITHAQFLKEYPIDLNNIQKEHEEIVLSTDNYNNELKTLKSKLIEIENKQNTTLDLIQSQQNENEIIQKDISHFKEQSIIMINTEKQNIDNILQETPFITKNQTINAITNNAYYTYLHYTMLPIGNIVNSNLISFEKFIEISTIMNTFTPFVGSNYFNLELFKDIYVMIYQNMNGKNIKEMLLDNNIDDIVSIIYDNFINNCKRRLYYNKNVDITDENKIDLNEKEMISEITESYLHKKESEVKYNKDNFKKLIEMCVTNIIQYENNKNNILKDKNKNKEKGLYEYLDLIYNNDIYSINQFENMIIINNNMLSNENYIHLITVFKYYCQKITHVHFHSRINYEIISSKIFIQILYAMYVYVPHIKILTFSNCKNITSDIIDYLFQIAINLTSIQTFNIENNDLGNSFFIQTCSQLSHSQTISTFICSSNELTSQCGPALSDLISSNNSITNLILSENSIRGEGLLQLLKALSSSKRIINTLDLSYNNLSSEDFILICNYLKTNPNLHTINLSGNIIEMNSCVELGVALSKTNQIKVLNFANINILPEVCPVLFQHINVEELILDDNPLGEIGCLMLSKVLSNSKTVKKLSLKNIKVSDIGLIHLLGYIKVNKGLTDIHLEMNLISNKGLNKAVEISNGTCCKIYFTQSLVGDKDFCQNYGDLGNVILVY